MRNAMFIMILVVFLSRALSGCSGSSPPEEKKRAKIAIDAALTKLSPRAADYKLDVEMERTAMCLAASAFNKRVAIELGKDRKTLNDAQERAMKEVATESLARCDVLTKIYESVNVFFEQAKAQNALPQTSYLFSIFDGGHVDGKYQEKKLGLFATMAECVRMESLARDAGFGTKRCELWQPTS